MRRLPIHLSVAAFRMLVRVRYPTELRRRYGADIVGDFRTLVEAAVEAKGARGLVDAWSRVLLDALRRQSGPLGEASRGPRSETTTRGVREGRRGMEGWMRGTFEDVGFAVRSLGREPRFAGALVAVLAVGIALNVAVFSVVNAYLLKPLPYPHSERLVQIDTWGTVSWMEADEILELAVSWDLDVFTIVGEGRPELLPGAWVTPDFLEAYDVRAALGRTFADVEAGPGAPSVAMISDRVWRERYGSDPGTIGRTFHAFMSDRPEEAELFTIVGVLPADFWYVNDYTDVLAPIREERAVYTGRLRPEVGVAEAQAYLARLSEGRIRNAPPGFRVTVASLHEQYVRAVRPTLTVLQIAALLVLLIACANGAVLLLVRSIRREREWGIRRALGAGRARVGRQLVAEGLIVASVAGALGAVAAAASLTGVRDVVMTRLGRSAPGGIDGLALDGTVLAATVLLTVAVGLVFGLVPLLTSRRAGLSEALSSATRGGVDTRGRNRTRNVMVVAEVALSLALLTGAGLMIRSAVHLQTRELGFVPEGMVRGGVGVREASYPTPGERHAFFDRLVAEVRARPGVATAALTNRSPFASDYQAQPVEADRVATPAEAFVNEVGEGYFAAMGIPLLRGRDFTPGDVAGSEPVAIVSESVADALWPGLDPLGRGIRLMPPHWVEEPPEPGPFSRVVGVVGDIERGVGRDEAGDVYGVYRQGSPLWMSLLVRPEPGAPPVVPVIEGVLGDLDPEAPLYDVRLLDEAIASAVAPTRFLAALLSGFAAVALLLAILGLYGVIAYSVRQRRRDVAIRVALGADRGSVVRIFLASGLGVALVGVALGTVGGIWLGGALDGQLHGVAAGDLPTRFGLAAALLATSLVAVWVPARAAARSDPMGVLREE